MTTRRTRMTTRMACAPVGIGAWLAVGLAATCGFAPAASAAETPLFEAWRGDGNYRIYSQGVGVHDSAGFTTFSSVEVTGQVAKAYLYWIGANLPASDTSSDPNITLTRQGGASTGIQADSVYVVPFERPFAPGTYYWNANHTVFVADVTQWIVPGTFDYSISDFNMDQEYGVGLQVVFQDQRAAHTEIAIHQGHDFAFAGWPNAGSLNRTEVVTHTFEPADHARVLEVTFFVGGGESTNRPDQLWMLTGTHGDRGGLPTELITNNLGVVIDSNPIEAEELEEWDTIVKKIVIEQGQTFAAFQFQSGGGSGTNTPPESFSWMSATFSMQALPEPATAVLLATGALMVMRRRR